MNDTSESPQSSQIEGNFIIPPLEEVIYGAGSVRRLGELLERYGARRAIVITGRSLFANDELMGRVMAAGGERIVGVFHETLPHAPRQVVLNAAAMARELAVDAVISFGGGSPNDTTTAVAMAVAADIRTLDDFDQFAVKYTYPDKLVVPPIPGEAPLIFAIPTALSAGEYTQFVGVTNEAQRSKDLYISRKLAAKGLILDPELTLATPDWLWLSSGVRSVDHAVEGLCSKGAHPITEALGMSALRMLLRNLRACAADSTDVAARMQCQIASWMSVLGLANVGLGLSHGIGHQLGGRCDVPHGYTSCVMLSHVVRFNRTHIGERAKWIAGELGLTVADDSAPAAADALADAIADLVRDLGQPARLRDVGVSPDDFEPIARESLQDMVVASNPRPISSVQEVIELMQAAY